MFEDTKLLPEDSIFGVVRQFNADKRPNKINLSVGVYTDEDGGPFVFPCVQKVAREVDVKNFNYLPIRGDSRFLTYTKELFLGGDTDFFAAQQTCGGTHACALFAEFLKNSYSKTVINLGTPCWDNYFQIFKEHLLNEVEHLNPQKEVNFYEYKNNLQSAPLNSVLLLQGGPTHNPTGKNLSVTELKKLLPIIKENNIYVFVDFAYLGFGDSMATDKNLLEFLNKNLDEFAVSISYSKNASLYKHRTGALLIKTQSEDKKQAVESNLQNLVRRTVSNMPAYGSDIMVKIFEDYSDTWQKEVETARVTISQRRDSLVKQLPQEFSHLDNCAGMFGITGLNKKQVALLQEEHAVYMPGNGRINFAGIRTADIKNIADAFSSVV